MVLHVNFNSGVPVYLQIVQQVKAATAAGRLRAGDTLPSVRALSEELRINRNTAAKAYGELESEGVIETRQGAGCFVRANGAPSLTRAARQERLRADLDALLVKAHHLGVDGEELTRLLEERRRALHNARAGDGTGATSSRG